MKKIFFILAVLFTFSFAYSDSCTTSTCCSIASTCPSGTDPIFSISSTTNAHAALSDSAYTNKVCCPFPIGTVTALKLSGTTNAHAGTASSSYTTKIDVSTLSCVDRTTACLSGEVCVVKLSGATNAHVEQCSNSTTAYSTRICCKPAQLPPSCLINPASANVQTSLSQPFSVTCYNTGASCPTISWTKSFSEGSLSPVTGTSTTFTAPSPAPTPPKGTITAKGNYNGKDFSCEATVNIITPLAVNDVWEVSLSVPKSAYTVSEGTIPATITVKNNSSSTKGGILTLEIRDTATGALVGRQIYAINVLSGRSVSQPHNYTINASDEGKNLSFTASVPQYDPTPSSPASGDEEINVGNNSDSKIVSIIAPERSVSIPEMPVFFVILIAISVIAIISFPNKHR